jgi:hypothetical protein
MRKILAIVTSLAVVTFAFSTAWAAKETHPSSGPPGTWHVIGTTHAGHTADHDAIVVKGPGDAFRRIKFRVKDAPLNLRRLIVTYDNNTSQSVETRNDIPKGGESRVIDLTGGQRHIKRIDFWYDTKGLLKGTADVTVYGMK